MTLDKDQQQQQQQHHHQHQKQQPQQQQQKEHHQQQQKHGETGSDDGTRVYKSGKTSQGKRDSPVQRVSGHTPIHRVSGQSGSGSKSPRLAAGQKGTSQRVVDLTGAKVHHTSPTQMSPLKRKDKSLSPFSSGTSSGKISPSSRNTSSYDPGVASAISSNTKTLSPVDPKSFGQVRVLKSVSPTPRQRQHSFSSSDAWTPINIPPPESNVYTARQHDPFSASASSRIPLRPVPVSASSSGVGDFGSFGGGDGGVPDSSNIQTPEDMPSPVGQFTYQPLEPCRSVASPVTSPSVSPLAYQSRRPSSSSPQFILQPTKSSTRLPASSAFGKQEKQAEEQRPLERTKSYFKEKDFGSPPNKQDISCDVSSAFVPVSSTAKISNNLKKSSADDSGFLVQAPSLGVTPTDEGTHSRMAESSVADGSGDDGGNSSFTFPVPSLIPPPPSHNVLTSSASLPPSTAHLHHQGHHHKYDKQPPKSAAAAISVTPTFDLMEVNGFSGNKDTDTTKSVLSPETGAPPLIPVSPKQVLSPEKMDTQSGGSKSKLTPGEPVRKSSGRRRAGGKAAFRRRDSSHLCRSHPRVNVALSTPDLKIDFSDNGSSRSSRRTGASLFDRYSGDTHSRMEVVGSPPPVLSGFPCITPDDLTPAELREFEQKYGSPHHARSKSVKGLKRPNLLALPVYRPRVTSLPGEAPGEEEYYRLRHFSITGRSVINRGDSFKSRRSRSNTSMASDASSTENMTAGGVPVYGAWSQPCSLATSAASSAASSRASSASEAVLPYRVIMLGAPGVGKTTLCHQFMTSEHINAYDSSLDDEFGEKSVFVLLDGEESEINFVDHPADEMSVENYLTTYEPHAFVVVFSVVERSSFQRAEEILQYLWRLNVMNDKGVILVANKCDIVRSRCVTEKEGSFLAESYDCKFIETSSGLNHKVDELLVGILKQIRLKLHNPEGTKDHFKKRSSRRKKYRGSKTSASLRVKSFLTKVCGKEPKSKSCENLHVL
ncbi:uncharacterized protein LOC143020914 isoform X2 [Oratosquilla oratoria]|uniref:uncharacterized protein LOC143020914 isoform X2 n=1 Tax=Oratosquilla oratoria TaxID=337810 RepID=UPI003F7677F5